MGKSGMANAQFIGGTGILRQKPGFRCGLDATVKKNSKKIRDGLQRLRKTM
jgi:hypothetical protein